MKKFIVTALSCVLISACSEGVRYIDFKYQEPYKYYGKESAEIKKEFPESEEKAGYIWERNKLVRMMFQMGDGKVEYIEIQVKNTAPCDPDKMITTAADKLLERFRMGEHIMRLEAGTLHPGQAIYNDDTAKFRVSVKCYQAGEPLTVAFSKKYYRAR